MYLLGFTTGIDDEDLPPDAKAEIAEINKEASEAVDTELSKYGNDGRRYETRPGRTPLETLEENILQILDSGKAKSGRRKGISRREERSSRDGDLRARGSMDNLAMMAGSLDSQRSEARGWRGAITTGCSTFPERVKGAKEKGSFPHPSRGARANRVLYALSFG